MDRDDRGPTDCIGSALAVLSDPDGKLSKPGLGGYLYIAGVVGVVTFLAYTDRNRDSSGKNRENRPGLKGR